MLEIKVLIIFFWLLNGLLFSKAYFPLCIGRLMRLEYQKSDMVRQSLEQERQKDSKELIPGLPFLFIPLLSSDTIFSKVLCDPPCTSDRGVEVQERGWSGGRASEQGYHWWLCPLLGAGNTVRRHGTIAVSGGLLHKRWQWVLSWDFSLQSWVMELNTCHLQRTVSQLASYLIKYGQGSLLGNGRKWWIHYSPCCWEVWTHWNR